MPTADRREFLLAAAAMGLSPLLANAVPPRRAERCIWINLVGGPGPLDTFDPKPDAPAEVRGPFASIATRTPGIRFSELFPRTAALSDRIAVVRSVFHDAMPIHETGLQLLQTGRLAPLAWSYPHLGPFIGRCRIVGPELGFLGVSISKGQDGLNAIPSADPFGSVVGELERGLEFAIINTSETVYDSVTWDCHADRGSFASSLEDYRTIGPSFDAQFATLITSLEERGMLESTLVVAVGEMGRTPRMNDRGGRDHWTGCWSMLMAGGGVRGGAVVGASDAIGAYPADRPIDARMVPSTVLHAMGDPLPGCLPAAGVIDELFR